MDTPAAGSDIPDSEPRVLTKTGVKTSESVKKGKKTVQVTKDQVIGKSTVF